MYLKPFFDKHWKLMYFLHSPLAHKRAVCSQPATAGIAFGRHLTYIPCGGGKSVATL
jgi:hypothetical protein